MRTANTPIANIRCGAPWRRAAAGGPQPLNGSRRIHTALLTLTLTCSVLFYSAFAVTNETARVLDGAGGWSSNTLYRTVIAAGQGGPAGFNSDHAYNNYSGFLQAFLMHPGTDTDADGIADENDPDNDDDGLDDAVELAGAAFDPQTATDPQLADSDGDGAQDGNEAGAGTNPHDAASRLEIVDITAAGSDVAIRWRSRGGYSYEVVRGATPPDLDTSPTVVDVITASGGLAPWYETESGSTNAAGAPIEFYRVRVAP